MTTGSWRRPRRFDYNLVVIGAGSAGLTAAYVAAAAKAKVALIEKDRMGGDCLNTGCVPSKALIRSARFAAELRRGQDLGFCNSHAEVDFAAVMARVRRVIGRVQPHDSVERYTRLGVDCIAGEARIRSPWCVEVGGRSLSTRAIVIATGARPTIPPVPGISQTGYLTSDTVWGLKVLPRRLLVLGGGPVGCELAQCFARFGSQVTIVEMAPRILLREDPEVSAAVADRLRAEGADLRTDHRALEFGQDADGQSLSCAYRGGTLRLGFDQLLVAVGRKANIEGFGLEELGIPAAPAGTIETNAWLQTLHPSVYACGDVAGPYPYTHTAAHQAWHAAVNALLGVKGIRVDYAMIPRATFTDPEVAGVGMNEQQARQQGIAYELTRYGLDDLDRAIADEAAHGFIKLLTVPGKDRILGATIVGEHAADLIAEYALAMRHRLGLKDILGTIHIYPTLAEANKLAAGVWRRAHTPERLLRWLARYHAWRRG